MTNISNIDARMSYENAKIALQKAFPDVQNIAEICKLTQSTLRLEQLLVAGNTSYQFNVLSNEPLISNTEKRLLQQDSAIVQQMGLFVGVPASATDTSFLPLTYPNQVAFGTADALALNSLYNGNLSLAVNNDILIPNWDLYKHLSVPETQQTAALGSASPMDENYGACQSFFPVEPNVVLIGSKNNVITVTIPKGISAVAANSRMILILRCIIAQNSTVVS